MKRASDFKQTALNALKGHWVVAVIAGLIATLLGGATGTGADINFNVNSTHGGEVVINEPAGGAVATSLKTALGEIPSAVWGVLGAFIGVVILIGLAIGIAYFILGSFVQVGYARFNLNAVDGEFMSLDNLFSYISQWKRTALASFLQNLYIILWTCLLIVPGIVASYSYAMTKYILAEDDTISASEAITRSKEIMRGNKWRLFCLELSFIGWALLTALTFGVGNLWLTPYRHAAEAAFYRHITGTETVVDRAEIVW